SADLVEVDLFDRRAVDRRFCDRDATERLPRALLCTVRRVAAVDDLLDVPQVSVGMLVRQVEPDASTVDTASNGALRVHGDVAEAEAGHEIAQPFPGQPQVEKRPQCHVAADAGE